MLTDRASAYAQWDMPLQEALRREGAHGVPIVFEEGATGADRFANGAGRHGNLTA
jgi:enoyl-CoA hydratase